jgi:DNA-dependent protein kinase catalytic subunit
LEPSLVRHALLALAGGASGVPRARHLIPRVLALLRGGSDAYGQTVNASDAVANEFASFVSKVPPWLFVEWVPQMLSSLEIPGAGGDALVPCLESLASEYPSAVHPDFHLSRAHFTELGVGRSTRLNRMLHSHSRDAFTRAVTLLDFPHKRLEWWRQHLKMLAHAGTSDEVLSAIADEMVRDVADPDEPMLGNLNARFAQVARGPLTKAIGGSDRAIRLRKGELARWLPQAVAEAERKIVEHWMKQFGKAQELPRQRVTQFSQWFASFEPPVAGGAGVTGRRHLSPTFRMGIEVPGQYDALTGPPDVTSHAQIVGFEPEVDLFRSKQFPKKLVARGSDGREYPFVAKGSEDLRQDDRIERLFRAMDALLAAHPGSRNRGLSVRTFHVAPLSARCGLLEFVGGTTPVLEAVRGSTKQGNVCIKEHQHWIRAQASARDKDVTAQNATIDPKNGMYRRRSGLGRGEIRKHAGERQRGFSHRDGSVPSRRRVVHTEPPGAGDRGRGRRGAGRPRG